MKTLASLLLHLSSLCPCTSLSSPFHPQRRIHECTWTLLLTPAPGTPFLLLLHCSPSQPLPFLTSNILLSSVLEEYFLNTISRLAAPFFFFCLLNPVSCHPLSGLPFHYGWKIHSRILGLKLSAHQSPLKGLLKQTADPHPSISPSVGSWVTVMLLVWAPV